MHEKLRCITVLSIMLIMILLFTHARPGELCAETAELFTTKKEKADDIYNWFAKHNDPKYTDYKKDMRGASNIVEYEDVMHLIASGHFTPDNVSQII